MLFSIKNYWYGSLLLAGAFIVTAFAAKNALEITWVWMPQQNIYYLLLLATAAIGISDGGLHGVFSLLVGKPYLQLYRSLVEHFSPQGALHIITAGILAGAEELVFRGILLEILLKAPISQYLAVFISAIFFGIAHLILQKKLYFFGIWAIWEGCLLATVYLMSGSLLVSVIIHSLHDIMGFTVFAVQRRTGWLLGDK